MTTPATTKTDLLLLGLLLDRPMHGYEVYQQIQAEGIDEWFHVSAAGVYYSLGKLYDLDLLASSQQRGERTSRKSVYRLTEKGRSAFFTAMEEQLASQDEPCLDYDLVIYLLNRLPLQRAFPRLQQRQTVLAELAQDVESTLEAERDAGSSPLRLAILDHKRRFLEMEQTWLAGVIHSIQANGEPGDAETGQRGLMILRGDLHHYHWPDLIRLIVSAKHSGTLTVTDGADIRTLSFEDGQPVCASYQRRDEPPTLPSSPKEVLNGLCELFCLQEGRFTFDQTIDCQDWSVPLEISAENLILQGCRRVDDWAIIQRLVPSADAIFELSEVSAHLDALTLTPTEEQVVATVDGVKNVAAIARDLDLTLFETSQAMYCLAAVGVLCTADPDKIRLRRVFREMAELVCNSTKAWRSSPDDRTCEEEVNRRAAHLPLCLDNGRIEDQADPKWETERLQGLYQHFLQIQFEVVRRHFGLSRARQAFERALRQLAPELQDVANRYGFDRVTAEA
jgi:DNA-binding PadR family transcriptional regulator